MNPMPSVLRSSRSRPMRVVAGAAAAVIALLAVTAGVAAHGPNPVLPGANRWSQDQALTFAWRAGSVPATGYQVAIKAAAADASATRGSRAATFTYAAGASNLIGYGVGATCGPNGIACFNRNAPTSFSMWMREQGHRFDWGSLRWCQAYTTWPDGCYDVEDIMLDEFGHVEILDHHVNYANDPRLHRCGRPGALPHETEQWLGRPRLRALRHRDAAAAVRHGQLGLEVLHVPRPVDDARAHREPDDGDRGDQRDPDRDPQGGGRSGLCPARG